MRLEYYIATHSPSPQLWDGNKLMTATIFKKCKKDATHLLRYFTIHFDEKGNQEVKCNLPDAFAGHILAQMNELFIKE